MMSDEHMALVRHAIELGWDAVRDSARIKVLAVRPYGQLCVQFDPADTLVFPMEYLTEDQRARLLEARPDLDLHVRFGLQVAREQQGH